MSAHTPGPWHSRINGTGCAFLIRDKTGRIIATPSWHESIDTHYPLKPQSEANSRLMAAAPDLLNELIAIRAAMQAIEAHCVNERGLQGIDHADEGKRIRAAMQAILAAPSAIAKATGGAG